MSQFFVGRAYTSYSPFFFTVLFETGQIRLGDLVFVPSRGIYLGAIEAISHTQEEKQVCVRTCDQKYVLGIDFEITDQLETSAPQAKPFRPM